MANFQLSGLAYEPFQHYFAQSDQVLRSQGIRRVRATASHAFPCRVSLTDAACGEELLLLPFEHHQVASPYRASGPIYVRKGASQAVLPAGVVPPYIALRLIPLRAYGDGHIMVRADVADGTEISNALQLIFQEANVSYVHLHNAKPGCFACSVSRATGLS